MNVIFRVLAEPDPSSLLGLILILCWVGSVMVASRRDLHAWGYRLAATSFVGYGLYAAAVEEPKDADSFLFIAIRSLFAAGWMLGGSWIVLALGGFIADRLTRAFERPPKSLPMHWPDPPRLPAPLPVEVIDVNPEPVKEETLREKVSRQKQELQERLDIIATELTDIGGDETLAKDVVQELSAREVEKYLRRLSNELDHR